MIINAPSKTRALGGHPFKVSRVKELLNRCPWYQVPLCRRNTVTGASPCLARENVKVIWLQVGPPGH